MAKSCAGATMIFLLLATGCGGQIRQADKPSVGLSPTAQEADKEGRAEQLKPMAKVPSQPRKIEYSAEVRLITEQFDETVVKIKALAQTYKKNQGYISHDDLKRFGGGIRQANWTIRIPVDQFDAFREELLKVGEVEQDTLRTQDRTEEFYDKEARVKNLQTQLEGLREIYKRVADKVDKTESLLAVDQKIRDVTDELERTQGRLKLLDNLTSLTTVNVHLQERQKYIPGKGPNPREEPTFGQRVSRTWSESGEALLDAGKATILFLVAIAPWLPLILIGAWIGRRLLRRLGARIEVKKPSPKPVSVEADSSEKYTSTDSGPMSSAR